LSSEDAASHIVSEGKLLIRADANLAMGTGHVMRCLALAQSWQDTGGSAVFAIADPVTWARERLSKESVETLLISASPGTEEDARETSELARQHAAAWVVVDGYQFGADYQRTLKSAGFKILFLDDYGHAGLYSADLVLNQNVSADEKLYEHREPYTRLLPGPRYCLLRREFNTWRGWRREIVPRGRRVLVTMGGSDPENFTERAIAALNLIEDEELEATVVVGGTNARAELLDRIAAKAGKKIVLRRDVSNMADLMVWADVAVSGAGGTCWEICQLGLPALLIDLAENQTPLARELDRRGCAIHLGCPRDISSGKLAEQLQRLLRASEDRQAMSLRCQELVDGEGAQRVVSALHGMELRIRPARENDSQLLWEWANEPQVRAASFSSAPIPWVTHVAWFTEKLRQDECHIFIAEDDEGRPIGQIRFNSRIDGDAEIDVSIAKAWRGRGFAVPLIRQAARLVLNGGGHARLHAFVKPENVASVKAFEKGGFERIGIDQVQGNAAIHLIYEGN
jgi:UDP-2,4-diacetamido-2,4,6-trideoxy-beta-L-altropyranose hydrolase